MGSSNVDSRRDDRQGETMPALPKLKKQITLEDQQTRLPFRRIAIIYTGIGLALILSFMDQTSTSTAAPTIGTDLHGSASISWVGTSYYVANCACHMVYGRLSDIFGRKVMLAVATAFLAFGNLLCGFAKTPVELYVFRAIAGMGGQGINSMGMVIISDIVSLKDRGKYQGFVAAYASLGNAIGPFLGGALAGSGHWQWVFWISSIMGAIVIVIDWLLLPLKPVHGSMSKKLKQIDYLGIFLSAASTVLLLVPISGGGSTFAWSSATVIVMLILGVLSAVAFVVWQYKYAVLPILPLRIFNNRNSAAVMFQSFIIGMIYYGNIFYVPIYLQSVKGYTPFISGCYVLAQTFPGAIWGIVSGFYISKTNHYTHPIVVGCICFIIGLGLQIRWNQYTSIGEVVGVLQITALAQGWNLQTTLVAALATTKNQDRAVTTTARNFFRTLGGAFGLAMANTIYNNQVASALNDIPALSAQQRDTLLHSSLTLKSLPSGTRTMVENAFVHGLRTVFIAFTALAGLNLLGACFLKEVPFRKDSPELEAEKRRNKGLKDPEKAMDRGNAQRPSSTEMEDIDNKRDHESDTNTDRRESDAATLAEQPLELVDVPPTAPMPLTGQSETIEQDSKSEGRRCK